VSTFTGPHQTASAATGHTGCSFFQHALAPCFLKAFAAWETLPPGSGAQRRRTVVSHAAKTKKTTGLTQIVFRRGTLCDRLPVDHGGVHRIFMEKIAYFGQNCLPNWDAGKPRDFVLRAWKYLYRYHSI